MFPVNNIIINIMVKLSHGNSHYGGTVNIIIVLDTWEFLLWWNCQYYHCTRHMGILIMVELTILSLY